MKRVSRVKVVVFAALSGFWVGCDAISLDPPPNAELAAEPSTGPTETAPASDKPPQAVRAPQSALPDRSLSSDASSGPRVRGIELILAHPITVDREYLTQVVRRQAGKRALAFRLTAPESAGPMTAAHMAQAIRKAAEARHDVILEPLDAPEVCDAVRVFQTTGLGLVLLDNPLTCAGKAVSANRIRFAGFPERGEAIVAAAIEEAARQKMPPLGSIAIVRNRTVDSCSNQRFASLAEALDRGKRPFDIVRFEGSESEAHARLIEYLKAHPNRSIVLAEDHAGLLGAYKAHADLTTQGLRAFVLAGYALSDVRKGFPGHAACVAFAYQDLDVYSRKAAEIVVQASKGQSAPVVFDCDLPFVRTVSAESPAADGGEVRP